MKKRVGFVAQGILVPLVTIALAIAGALMLQWAGGNSAEEEFPLQGTEVHVEGPPLPPIASYSTWPEPSPWVEARMKEIRKWENADKHQVGDPFQTRVLAWGTADWNGRSVEFVLWTNEKASMQFETSLQISGLDGYMSGSWTEVFCLNSSRNCNTRGAVDWFVARLPKGMKFQVVEYLVH